MQLSQLMRLYGKDKKIIDIITEDDVVGILKNSYNLKRKNFTNKEWVELMKGCSKRIGKFNFRIWSNKGNTWSKINKFLFLDNKLDLVKHNICHVY